MKITLKIVLIILLLLLVTVDLQAAVLVKNKQWAQHKILNVVFLGGSTKLHRLVEEIAPQWVTDTNLSFRFYDSLAVAPPDTQIRISFDLQSGSRLGDHQDYRSTLATMNLFDLISNQISDSSARRIILHEFGHALGLEHEYRSSYWPYGKQSIEKIVSDCYPKMENIGYSKIAAKSHCNAINTPLKPNSVLQTAYDENSIMNYPMTFELHDGIIKNINATFKLSILDHYAMQRWYPKEKSNLK